MSELRESMWDLVYGLLSEEESQALVARIKSEPDAARLYAEVKLEAGLVAQAARVEDSSISLKADEVTTGGGKYGKATPAHGISARWRGDFHRGAAWLVGLAATALAGLLAVGLSWQRTSPPQLASALVAADVFVSQPMLAGLTCPVEVRTYRVNSGGEPTDGAAANVELFLVDRAGNPRFKKAVQTNEIGHATLDLPGEALEPGVRMEIAANKQSPNSAPSQQVAQMADAKMDNSAAATVELPVQPEPKIAYYLCAEPMQQPDQQVPVAEWYFNAFTATPAAPEAAENAMAAVQSSAANEPRTTAPAAASVANGAMPSQNRARTNTQLRALSDKVAAGEAVSDYKSQAVVPSDQPITFAVPEQLEGRPLRVAAMNRGVTVANQVINSAPARERQRRAQVAPGNKTELAKEQLSLAVPPEADGLVEVQVFDESKSQEEPVDRQYVVRQPKRRLHIDVADSKARYSPGEQVALTLRCADENGKPAANTQLGVRIWSESAIRQSGEEPVLLADAVDHGLGEVVQNAAAPPASAEQAAASMSSIGQLGRDIVAQPTVGQPVELATNREIVKSALVTATASAENARQRAVVALGGAAIVGGVAVVLLLAMLILLRLSIGWRTIAPGFAVAIASVLIGLGWIGWLPEGRFGGGIAMAPAAPAASLASSVTDKRATPEVKRLDEVAAESSLRERDEKGRVPAEAAPALASSPAPTAAAAPKPTEPIAERAGPSKPESSSGQVGLAGAAGAPGPQSYSRGGGPIVTLQVPGGQQARSFKFAKDSETDSVNRRLASDAGGIAGAAGGRPIAGPPAVVTDQLKQKSDSADDKKEQLAERAAGKPQSAAAPAALYFNPLLMTDSEGKATIQFTMPQAEAEYRLLVDALGQGRIGSRQQTIVCGGAPSK